MVVPAFIPLVFAVVLLYAQTPIGLLKILPINMPSLPPLNQIRQIDETITYFQYSVDENFNPTIAQNVINNLIQNTNSSIQPMYIQNFDQEKQHWNEIIVLNSKSREVYEDSAYQQDICNDTYNYYKIYGCNFTLADVYPTMLRNTYNLTQEQEQMLIDNNFSTIDNRSTIFHIRFINNTQQINDTKFLSKLQVSIYYNETFLDELQKRYPDKLAMLLNSNRQNPYWTGYALTLQKIIDTSLIKLISNCDVDFTYNRLPDIKQTSLPIGMFFGVSTQIAWSSLIILATIVASNQRGKSHIVLKRLGVSNIKFWISNTIFTLLLVFISSMIILIVWKLLNVIPYQFVSWRMGILVNTCIAISITIQVQFLSLFFGNHNIAAIIASCIFSGIFILYPGLSKIDFQQQSFYDPSMWWQEFKITLLFLFPGYNINALQSSILVHLSSDVLSGDLSDYDFVGYQEIMEEEQIIDIQSLWNSSIYDSEQLCYNILSNKGEQHPYMYSCYYYNYKFINNCYLSLIYLVIYTPLLCYLSFVIPDINFRPFPWYFLFDKKFWQARKKYPKNSGIKIQNMNIIFKVHSLNKNKRKQVHANKDFIFIQKPKSIQSLLGETGQGKSVFMSTLCGELTPISKKDYPKWKQLKNNYKKPTFKLFDSYDLMCPYDAYYVKKHIGYCPQEMNNVWPTQSVLNNVYYTILIRSKLKKIKLSKKQIIEEAKTILRMLDLSDALHKKPNELSGGMLRRLALANSLAGQPTLLVLDEITSGVDSVVKLVMFQTISGYVRRSDCSIIISSHDTSEIQQTTKFITVIDNGKTLYSNIPIFQLYQEMDLYELTAQGNQNFKLSKILNELNAQYDFSLIVEENILSSKRTEYILHFKTIQVLQVLYEEIIQFQKEQSLLSQQFTFSLQKAQLRTFYHRLLKQRHFEEEQEENAKNKAFTFSEKQQQNKKQKYNTMGRIPALFKIYFKEDQKGFFLCQIISIAIIIFMIVLFAIIYQLVPQIAQLAQLMQTQNRQQTYNRCFSSIDNYLPQTVQPMDALKNCLVDRNSYVCQQIFDKDIKDNDANTCGYYLRFFGFDEPEPYRVAVGQDYDYFTYPVMFTTVDQGQQILDLKFADYDPNNVLQNNQVNINTSQFYQHNSQRQNQYQQRLLNYIPTIKSTLNNNTRLLTNGFTTCINNCNDLTNQCPAYDNSECLQFCQSLNVDPSFQQQYLEYNPIIVLDNDSQILDYYNKYNKEFKVIANSPLNMPYTNMLADYYISNQFPVGNIKFNRIDMINDRITNLDFNFSTTLPFGGRSKQQYSKWVTELQLVESYDINCDTLELTPRNYQRIDYYPTTVPVSRGWTKDDTLSNDYQIYPYRRHVSLLDSQSQVINYISNAVMNMNAENDTIYEYSLEAVAMPRYTDGESHVTYLSYLYSIYALPLLICPLLQGFHVAIRYGQNIQDKIEILLQYRQITKLDIIVVRILYFTVIQFISLTIYIIIIVFVCPDLINLFYYGKISILWTYLSGFSIIITSMIICKLSRGSKLCIYLLVLYIFASILLSVLGVCSEIITIVIGFFVPSYVFIYLINTQLINIPMVQLQFYGIGIIILQTICLICSGVQIQQLRSRSTRNPKIKSLFNHKIKKELMQKKMLSPADMKQSEKSSQNTMFKTRSVFFTYDQKQIVLNNVSLEVGNHRIFGLLGQNGCGKSTLIQNIVGMYAPQFGLIGLKKESKDKYYTNLPLFTKTSRYVAVVPQFDIYFANFTLLEHMILFSQIELGFTDYNKISKILKTLQITQYANQPLKTLSGGSKRRASIAFALVGNPRLLILDEVTTGVGDTVKRKINESIFSSLHENPNLSCIVVTHDMEECQILLDECVIMAKGNVLISGNLNQLQHKFKLNQNLILQNFDLHDNQNKIFLDQMRQKLDVLRTYVDKNEVEIIFKENVTYEQVLKNIIYSPLVNYSWILQQPGFEQVFIKVIQDFNNNQMINDEIQKDKQGLKKDKMTKSRVSRGYELLEDNKKNKKQKDQNNNQQNELQGLEESNQNQEQNNITIASEQVQQSKVLDNPHESITLNQNFVSK